MAIEKLVITPQSSKGEDRYQIFSLRFERELLAHVDELAFQAGISRNSLMIKCVEFALPYIEIRKE